MKNFLLKNKFSPLFAAAALGIVASYGASAGDQEYTAVKSQAEATYDADIKHCDKLSGNTKDICVKDAKAKRTSTEADAKADKTSAEAHKDANNEKLKAEYKAANERCDNLGGSEKTACQDRAKAKYNQ
jgi:hypothetical protein